MQKRTIKSVSSKQSQSKHVIKAGADDQMAVDQPVDVVRLFRQRILALVNEIETIQIGISQALADNLDALKSNIHHAYNLHAFYIHLANAIEAHELPTELEQQFRQLINAADFVDALYVELNQLDKFHNPVESSVFETYLAQVILKVSPTDVLRKINQKIISYCQDHKQALLRDKSDILKAELIKYHLCVEKDFKSKNPVDKFIKLLDRSLNDENNIVESITLHLIFFNHNHIFDTALLSDDPVKQAKFASKRADFHKEMRPKENGGMFSSEVRGRISVFDARRTREFGIADPADLPLILQSWHRNELTPHKYRAKANPASPIVKTFRSHRIPFIAGPSGTVADCIEGVELLFYADKLSKADMYAYITLIAAAEIALGCHSFYEVMLPAFNLPEKPANQTDWEWSANRTPYSYRLSNQVKESSEYLDLTSAFPQFIGDENLDILSAYAHIHKQRVSSVQYIQRYIRANQSYALLDQGEDWHQSNNFGQTKINHAQFRAASKVNVSRLRTSLSPLDDREILLVDEMLQAPVAITHYTNKASDILDARAIYSLHYMQQNAYKSGENHSNDDIKSLSNHGNVFFRYELIHQYDKPSRFGKGQFIFAADSTALFQCGWVSLFEMLHPFSASVAHELHYKSNILRKRALFREKYLHYPKNNTFYELDLYQSLFSGSDIKIGLALCVIRELRRIGGIFRDDMLVGTSLFSMNKLLSMLFRVEAKIPGLVSLDHSNYQYAEPLLMCSAVTANDLKKIDEILSRGVNIDLPVYGNASALMHAASLSGDQYYESFVHLHKKGAALRTGSYSVPFVLVDKKNIKCLAYLLENGLDLQMRDDKWGPSLIEVMMLQSWGEAKLPLTVFKGDCERVFMLIADYINSIPNPNLKALYLTKIESDDHVFSLYLARPQFPVQRASLFSSSLESYTYKQKLLARCGVKPAVAEPESMKLRY